MIIPGWGELKELMERKGYAFFDKGNYNLNLIAVRNSRNISNRFDDSFFVLYRKNGVSIIEGFTCATAPGLGPLESPRNPKGTAVLAPGQYRSCFKVGYHQGRYEAIVQKSPVTVYRDANKDNYLDYVNAETGYFGINIHRANQYTTSVQVDNWSEGCIVLNDPRQFATLMTACHFGVTFYGNSLTFTLLERDDFENG